MLSKTLFIFASLFLAAVAGHDVEVPSALESYLNVVEGLQMAEANSKALYIQRAIDGLKVAKGLLEKYTTGEYQSARANRSDEKSKQILAEVGLNGFFFVAASEEMKSAIELIIAADDKSTCKQAIGDLKSLFTGETGKIRELINELDARC